jgi:NADH dehydrogenase (ubiquinone) 1 alpha subcomplex subunit 2
MTNYVALKKANPDFPILIRECSGVEAKLIARYGGCLPPPPTP